MFGRVVCRYVTVDVILCLGGCINIGLDSVFDLFGGIGCLLDLDVVLSRVPGLDLGLVVDLGRVLVGRFITVAAVTAVGFGHFGRSEGLGRFRFCFGHVRLGRLGIDSFWLHGVRLLGLGLGRIDCVGGNRQACGASDLAGGSRVQPVEVEDGLTVVEPFGVDRALDPCHQFVGRRSFGGIGLKTGIDDVSDGVRHIRKHKLGDIVGAIVFRWDDTGAVDSAAEDCAEGVDVRRRSDGARRAHLGCGVGIVAVGPD